MMLQFEVWYKDISFFTLQLLIEKYSIEFYITWPHKLLP